MDKTVYGWHLPSWDTHFEKILNKSNGKPYQEKQRQLALKWTRGRQRVIDIGSNIGFWSKDFVNEFAHVEAFEPIKENRIAWFRNIGEGRNYSVYPFALGSTSGEVDFYVDPHCCGNAGVNPEGVRQGPSNPKDQPGSLNSFRVEMRTLDSFRFDDVDLIKIDCQGAELEVLRGAIETLTQHTPTLCLELATRNPQEVAEKTAIELFLEKGWGYTEVDRHGKDSIFYVK